MRIRPARPSEERVSQEDFLDRMSETAACTRSLSGPVRVGASKNLGAFSSQASTEAAVPIDGWSAADKTPSDLPFPSAKGRGVRLIFCLTACQCVSLAFRCGGHPRQLDAFSNQSGGKSVPAITVRGDPGQAGKDYQSVPNVTANWPRREAADELLIRQLLTNCDVCSLVTRILTAIARPPASLKTALGAKDKFSNRIAIGM